MVIYKAINKINNKAYIGLTTRRLKDRKKEHYRLAFIENANYAFHRALRKYGWNSFKWTILYSCNNRDELVEAEIRLIKEHNTFGKSGYNMSVGGEHYMILDSVRKKISDYFKGILYEERYGKERAKEIKNKISITKKILKQNKGKNNPMYNTHRFGKENPFYGRKHTKKTKKQISDNSNNSGENNGHYGKHHTDKAKKEIGKVHKGMVSVKDKNGNTFYVSVNDPRYESGELVHVSTGISLSEKTKKKISKIHKGKIISNKTKLKMSNTRKNMSPEQKTEIYRKVMLTRFNKVLSAEQLAKKLKEYKDISRLNPIRQ